MKGIILAAGDGGRLRPLTNDCPKVLLKMMDRPIISYPIDAMVAAGITEIGIVVGHQGDRVEAGVSELYYPNVRFTFLENPHYEGGNAVSVHTSRDFVGADDFVLCMGDHIIEQAIVPRLMTALPGPPVLCIDSAPRFDSQVNDATRVGTDDDGHLVRIGKELTAWNAVDIGVFRFGHRVFRVMDRLMEDHGWDLELSQVVQFLIDNEPPFATCDVSGFYWTDIDTEDDYRSTARYLESLNGSRV